MGQGVYRCERKGTADGACVGRNGIGLANDGRGWLPCTRTLLRVFLQEVDCIGTRLGHGIPAVRKDVIPTGW